MSVVRWFSSNPFKVARNTGTVKFIGHHRNVENYTDLLIVLLQKELKVRYNNTVLGYVWSVANPLAFAMVYFFAFRLVMRVPVENYSLVLLSGVFPWQWFSNCIGSAPNIFVGNASIIKKVSFPWEVLSLCAVLNHMIHYIISLPIIILFLLIFHESPSWTWLYGVPILLAIQFTMSHGMTLILASFNLFFRDLERLVSILLQIIFFLTPIIYPEDSLPHAYRQLLFLNPFAPVIVSWRELILNGTFHKFYILLGLIYAILFGVLGRFIYKKLSWKFAEVI